MARSTATAAPREFSVASDESGVVRIVNGTTRYTVAALTRREAKQLSKALRRCLKNGSKS